MLVLHKLYLEMANQMCDLVAPVFVFFLGLVWLAIPMSLVSEMLAAEEYLEYDRLKNVIYRNACRHMDRSMISR